MEARQPAQSTEHSPSSGDWDSQSTDQQVQLHMESWALGGRVESEPGLRGPGVGEVPSRSCFFDSSYKSWVRRQDLTLFLKATHTLNIEAFFAFV